MSKLIAPLRPIGSLELLSTIVCSFALPAKTWRASRWVRHVASSVTIFAAALAGSPEPLAGQEYTVDSPEVKYMVTRGVAFLEAEIGRGVGGSYDILAGYAVYKATEDLDHPVVKLGLERALKVVETIDEVQTATRQEFNYDISITAQLLASVDPFKYNTHLHTILKRFQDRQRPSGSFGYSESPYDVLGDTSQTQYVLLGLWAIEHADVDVPPEMIERALMWLNASQVQGGGWPYQFPNSSSFPPTHVMTATGMSAVMIGADILGILRGGGSALAGALEVDAGVPEAFRRVIERDPSQQTKVTQRAVSDLVGRGKSWLESRPYERRFGETWHYYWLYSIERYQALWDAMHGKTQLSPKWYNDGVKELMKLQAPNGGWGVIDRDFGTSHSCTAFAILFLLRTTQKSIGDLNEAVVIGGYGLQADMSQVDIVAGKIEDKKQITDIDQALATLSDSTDNQSAAKLASRIHLDSDPAARARQLETFSRLLQSSDAASRIVAAKVLSRGDNLDMVPHLINALSDIEPAVSRHAENSLRVLSRQLGTYKIPTSGEVSPEQQSAAQQYWRAWYKTIRPDYVFLKKD